MVDDFKRTNLDHSTLVEGIPELLAALKPRKDIILGLVTGNIEEIAYTKLRHFNIDDYFVLGGFGNLSPVRADLVEAAIKQAEKDNEIQKGNVFIIGDTIHDITAAKKSGVKVIATATGAYTYEQLEEKKPDYLLRDLKDTERIMDMIDNG
jgi:phosphoglycolate phosphatase-like HAD superfamily hydrolase